MVHKEMIQGSDEWLDYRMGKVTASKIIDIIVGARGSYRKERDNYMARLACEILTGMRQDNFTTQAMEHGTETEPLARSAYEGIQGVMVNEVGFIDYDEIEACGASPDGVIYKDNKIVGGVEIKCPNTATHIQTLKTGKIKPDYIVQMQFNMMCANVKWWDFVSYDYRLPENSQLFIKRIVRDDDKCEEIKAEITKFKKELAGMLEYLRNYKGEK